jgi:acetyltransferase
VADVPVADPITRLDGIPFLQGSEPGLKAIAALVRYADFQRAREAGEGPGRPRRRMAPAVAERARALVGGQRLTEREAKAVLALYGIPVTRERVATTLDEARAAAAAIGYPVVLKVESPDIAHKTEAGAVLLDVRDERALAEGFARVRDNARRAVPAAEIRGVLVQEMVGKGTEVLVGMHRDPQFGPVVAVGLGGILVETLRDVQLLLPPVGEGDGRAALERLRGYPILRGVRGAPPADLEALLDVIGRFSELCLDLGDRVQAIDVNPLIVFEAGRGACAVDCVIVPA